MNGKKKFACATRPPAAAARFLPNYLPHYELENSPWKFVYTWEVQTDSSHSKTHELGSIIVSMEPIDSLLWNPFLNCLQLLQRTLRNQKFESSPSCLSKLVPLLLTYLTSLIAMTIVFPSTSPLVLAMFPSCCPSSGLTLNQE